MRVSRRVPLLLVILLLVTPAVLAGTPSLDRTMTSGSSRARENWNAFNGLDLVLADFRGDGKLEVVAQNDNGYLYVLDPLRGRTLATLHVDDFGCTTYCYEYEGISGPINAPAVGDLDGDGHLSIVAANTAAAVARFAFVPQKSTDEVFVFTKMWERRFTQYGGFSMDASPILADLMGDGRLYTILVAEQRGLFALGPEGLLLWKVDLPGAHATPAAKDMDGDGRPEIIMADDAGGISVIDGRTGAIRWRTNAASFGITPASIPAAPTVVDLDGDKRPEVAFIARDAHEASDYSKNHFALIVLDHEGQLKWMVQPSWGAPMSHTRLVPVIVDGKVALLGADWNNIGHKPGNYERVGPGNVFLFDSNGRELWHTELNVGESKTDLIVADVLKKGYQQVLVAGRKGSDDGLLILDLRSGELVDFLQTDPWIITRGAVSGKLKGDDRPYIVLPVAYGQTGALRLYKGEEKVSPAMPGWGGVDVPRLGDRAGSMTATPKFEVRFNPTGNPWWVQTTVDATWTVAKVDVKLNDGPWAPLEHRGWGFASSISAPAGSTLTFRATSFDGRVSTSTPYAWPPGSTEAPPPPPPTSTTPPPPPPPATFTATFTPVNGNDWWLQVDVDANEPVAKVEASRNGGTWYELKQYDYGWARSLYTPVGTQVELRATSSTGALATGSYVRGT